MKDYVPRLKCNFRAIHVQTIINDEQSSVFSTFVHKYYERTFHDDGSNKQKEQLNNGFMIDMLLLTLNKINTSVAIKKTSMGLILCLNAKTQQEVELNPRLCQDLKLNLKFCIHLTRFSGCTMVPSSVSSSRIFLRCEI